MATVQREIRQFTDLDFAFIKHPITKNVSVKKDLNAIKQSVLNLLLLKSGDKPFHPEIESPIAKYLFENASPVVQFLIEEEIKNYLGSYEPRIEVQSVSVSFPNPNQIDLAVTGLVVNTTEPVTINLLVDRLR